MKPSTQVVSVIVRGLCVRSLYGGRKSQYSISPWTEDAVEDVRLALGKDDVMKAVPRPVSDSSPLTAF